MIEYKLPEEIVVGFGYEKSTLAFLTYQKTEKELAKQNAFNSWRDKKIEPKIFKNDPITGHKLIKFIGGDSYNKSRLSQARIEDPRGFSFEIKVDNLMKLLESSNLINQKLDGQYIYAWDNTELLLIDINSNEYKEARKRETLTEYDPKDCIPGEYYKKDDTNYLFLGKIKCLLYKDKHISQSWSDEKKILYPQYKYFYVFEWKYSWEENKENAKIYYYCISSSKLTKKYLKSDKKFEGNLQDKIEAFYKSDHVTNIPIEKNLEKFDSFYIDEKYKCTSIDDIPVRNTDYNIRYIYLDKDFIKSVSYRKEKDTNIINFMKTHKIKQDETGKSYIEVNSIDRYAHEEYDSIETYTLQELIDTGKFYILNKKKVCYNYVCDLFITDGKEKMMYNEI